MRDQIVEDFKYIISTDQGKRFVNWMLEFCGVYRQSFGEDTHKTAFFEGRRSVGLHLLRVFESMPELYIEFIKERTKNEREQQSIRDNKRSSGERS